VAYTSTDLDNIRAAIAKGELEVRFGDRSVTYRSIAELLQAEQHIANALATGRPKQFIGVPCKGL
jgi:hypothetical protein